MHIVIFSGGRGSATLQAAFVAAGHTVTVIVNSYDDGLSTGQARDMVPGMLGPSDIRKTVARFSPWARMLEWRGVYDEPDDRLFGEELAKVEELEKADWWQLGLDTWKGWGRPVDFCVGNMLFIGCYKSTEGVLMPSGYIDKFNAAVARYALAMNMHPRVRVLNVTDGQSLYLYVRRENGVVQSEGGMCGSESGLPRVTNFWLVNEKGDTVTSPQPNPEIFGAIATADMIVYGPGTQYSSLLPTYITAGLAEAVMRRDVPKVCVRNLEIDADGLDAEAFRSAFYGAWAWGVYPGHLWGQLVTQWYEGVKRVDGKHDGEHFVRTVVAYHDK